MLSPNDDTMIAQTQRWIRDVVVGCNFCPFAARELSRGTISYVVLHTTAPGDILEALSAAMKELDTEPSIETTLLILQRAVEDFDDYLDLLSAAEDALVSEGYEGVYQLASFHPQYLFAGAAATDPANYTNRSPYPMLHLLREQSVSKAVDAHPDVDAIPENNIRFANEKGLVFMKQLLASCM